MLTEKSVDEYGVKIGSDIQFISEEMLDGFIKTIRNETFWQIESYLADKSITLEDCVAFVNEAQRLIQEEKRRQARILEIQKERERKAEERKKRIGIIYVVTNKVKFKIGKTMNVTKRLQGLQTSSPDKLEIVIEAEVRGYDIVEKLLHEKYAHKRANGEWFDLSETDVQEIREWLEMYKVTGK